MAMASVYYRRRRAASLLLLVESVRKLLRESREERRQQSRSRSWQVIRDKPATALTILYDELCPENASAFTNYRRQEDQLWTELLEALTPSIAKKDTIMRQSISARDRLSVTLRYLSTGNTYQELCKATGIAPTTISKIIDETLKAIIAIFEDKLVAMPTNVEDWKILSDKFNTALDFPHCVGALGAKHIKYRNSKCIDSIQQKIKRCESVVFLAIVDADYQFIAAYVGRDGRLHNSIVFEESPLGAAINEGNSNFPPSSSPTGFKYKLPYVVVADDAFPLMDNLMKPYPEQERLSPKQRIFNDRVNHARSAVETAFDMLAHRWRVLLSTIPLGVEKVETVIRACVVLHNFLLCKRSARKWYFSGLSNGPKLTEHAQQMNYRSSDAGQQIRDQFADYLTDNLEFLENSGV